MQGRSREGAWIEMYKQNLENAKNVVSSSMEKLENTFNQFDNFSNQLKNIAKEDISKQFELYNEKSTENINFGKEANDFSKTNINANVGYLAAAQANIVQEQSVRLLS